MNEKRVSKELYCAFKLALALTSIRSKTNLTKDLLFVNSVYFEIKQYLTN